ncbi:hypothetical protein HUT06_25360 [Actinomadura sp. NAK00032]|uniref:hypothetical protein n=1 Tax=Actinomadura sp. NAK00032 TaxID=2742128 RepID=UPI0015927A56|nr:hypothetical protein [Actinomadura sp. NAK00032]QKW36938.1 hypothetical protein HUT06_25360 [Actinomadura sp. NAK00032]
MSVAVSGYIPWSALDQRPLYLLKGAAPAPGADAEREPGRHPKATVLEMAGSGFALTTSAEGKQHNYALLAVDDEGVVVSGLLQDLPVGVRRRGACHVSRP